jgi:multidrug efflux pump subunit AcrA (membrane-fusion protein)
MTVDPPLLPEAPELPAPPPGHRTGIARVHPWRIALIAALVLFILFLIGFVPRHRRDKSVQAAAERLAHSLPVVSVAKVRRSPRVATLLLPGNITPLAETYIYARATGYVRRRSADIGDRVRQGQLLADIDAPDLDAQVAQARATLAQSEQQLAQAHAALENAQAQEELARVTWNRYRVLVEHGAVSRQDADTQLAGYRTATANVRLQDAAIRTNEENVRANRANLDRLVTLQEFKHVRAPFTGVITARNFDVGALINGSGATSGATSTPNGGTQTSGQLGNGGTTGNPAPQNNAPTSPTNTGAPAAGSVEMFREAQIDRLRILVNVPQENAPTIRAGLPASVFVQEFAQKSFDGKVTRTSHSLEQTVRTLLTEVQVDNRQMLLLPGMYAQVQFSDTRPSPPLLIPGDAVIAVADGLEVAVLENLTPQDRQRLTQSLGAGASAQDLGNARRIHMQKVQVGRDYGTAIEITWGLQGWEYVVVSPGDFVQEGALVIPQTAAPIAGENSQQRRGMSEQHPVTIGSPSEAAPTLAPEQGSGRSQGGRK